MSELTCRANFCANALTSKAKEGRGALDRVWFIRVPRVQQVSPFGCGGESPSKVVPFPPHHMSQHIMAIRSAGTELRPTLRLSKAQTCIPRWPLPPSSPSLKSETVIRCPPTSQSYPMINESSERNPNSSPATQFRRSRGSDEKNVGRAHEARPPPYVLYKTRIPSSPTPQ
ncbi:hypothetical protein SAY87_009918 [Trapa incisa]|uniref:Uncharacterized protein n=1 Tax=Trapa incisa TaxID=236973 RepID=A0AAN7GDU5_9MYRT|nr:hypothetical protein SAY87_009918 [Trapa incisa]